MRDLDEIRDYFQYVVRMMHLGKSKVPEYIEYLLEQAEKAQKYEKEYALEDSRGQCTEGKHHW